MIKLRDLTLEELKQYMIELGQPPFRAKQIYDWLYKGVTEFSAMGNIPIDLREKLAETCQIDPLQVLREQKSNVDGTRKFLFGLPDGNAVESVYMEYKYGTSVCVSSQAGCRMGCAFCASGIDGLVRNLTAGEMLSQVLDIQRETGKPISHVVVMGTGEPFDNYEQLVKFIRLLHAPEGYGMSMRNITVSTCGLVPCIRRFGKDLPQVNLAISLHAPTNALRSELMPINRKYGLSMLLPAVRDYAQETGRRVTFEYALIHGVNDTVEVIGQLIQLIRGMLCHVNLIPLNEVNETGFGTVGRAKAREIATRLEDAGIPCTVRRQLGADIDGACGQLRLAARKSL